MKIDKNIGIDFDNTIVTYDDVFYKYAFRLRLISHKVEKNKKAIRDAIRRLPGGNDKWTELQGMVYGTYMEEAELVQGVGSFLEACKKNHFKVFIISHKTIYPAIGSRIDLQKTAKKWLENRDFLSKFGLTDSDVIFKETLQGKLDQIAQKKCAYFIDDLTEVLDHPDFPKDVKKILYGQQENKEFPADITHFKYWDEIEKYFFE